FGQSVWRVARQGRLPARRTPHVTHRTLSVLHSALHFTISISHNTFTIYVLHIGITRHNLRYPSRYCLCHFVTPVLSYLFLYNVRHRLRCHITRVTRHPYRLSYSVQSPPS